MSNPVFADRDSRGVYTWRGIEYPSVTRILGIIGSEDLRMYYARSVANECAGFIENANAGIITMGEAENEILDKASRMTAPLRWRDHKGNIGSIAHHYLYRRALGDKIGYEQDWVMQTIETLGLEKRMDSGEDYGSTLAQSAMPYLKSAEDFLNTYKPEFEMIGLEALVVNETHGYAGRVDSIFTLQKRHWPHRLNWPWEGEQKTRQTGDFKTSSKIVKSHYYQGEAYRRAEFIGLLQDESEHIVELTDGVSIVHITPDTGPHVLPCIAKVDGDGVVDESVWELFVCLRFVFGIHESMPAPKRVKSAAAKMARTPKGGKVCPF